MINFYCSKPPTLFETYITDIFLFSALKETMKLKKEKWSQILSDRDIKHKYKNIYPEAFICVFVSNKYIYLLSSLGKHSCQLSSQWESHVVRSPSPISIFLYSRPSLFAHAFVVSLASMVPSLYLYSRLLY